MKSKQRVFGRLISVLKIGPSTYNLSMHVESDIKNIVQNIHDSSHMAVVCVTGGGNLLMPWLLSVAGASRTVLESVVPYSSSALVDFLSSTPDQFVSLEAAKKMAKAAYARAIFLREGGEPVIGVGCTATIATDRLKKGDHKCHIVVCDATQSRMYSLKFEKGLRDRSGEDDIVSKLILRAICDLLELSCSPHINLGVNEVVLLDQTTYDVPFDALLSGHINSVSVSNGELIPDNPIKGAVLSGSFNPLHEGHKDLLNVASNLTGLTVQFEMSVTNVDKPTLTKKEISRRLDQFSDYATVILTRAPTFHEKSMIMPGSTFVVGLDTAERIIDVRYYDGEYNLMRTAFETIRNQGSRFLVAGRLAENRFKILSDLSLASEFSDLFSSIPESEFRIDISSSNIRGHRGTC